MRSVSIKNVNQFIDFCKKYYDYVVIKNKLNNNDFNIVLGSEFDEFEKLNNYLERFANYKGERDLDGTLHKKFLYKVHFTIDIAVSKIEKSDYNLLKDIDFKYCFWTIKININLNNEPFNFKVLPNVLLLCINTLNANKNIKFEIYISSVSEKDYWDISTYVSFLTLKYSDRLLIKCKTGRNYIKVASGLKNYGSLSPAVFVTQENISLLQQHLTAELWEGIKARDINDNNLGKYKDLKPYLQVCHKYLFEKFTNNESIAYKNLRDIAYRSSEFASYVETIPFLALLIFAMYDNSYRNDLLLYAKGEDYYNITKLDKTDFLLEIQGEQNHRRYESYSKKRDYIDVKNLLEHADESNSKKTRLHPTVISEIFECVSIAEGVLQILENAALHANGGLFSLRIFSRATQLTTGKDKKQGHIDYLNREYSQEYFELNGVKGTSYFLEVQISDLSNMSIPEKFVKYYTSESYYNAADIGEEEKEERYRVRKLIEEYKPRINLDYFFKPSADTKETSQIGIKKDFFNLSNKNFVFHYGLEIFRTLVTARKGIFAVCGYGESYENFGDIYLEIEKSKQKLIEELKESFTDVSEKAIEKLENLKDKGKEFIVKNITRNEAISGTTYRILLPLNHKTTSNHRVINNRIEISANDAYANEAHVCVVKTGDLLDYIKTNRVDILAKRQRIIDISYALNEKYSKYKETIGLNDDESNNKIVLCLDFYNDIPFTYFEEAIKGCVLFGLERLDIRKNKKLNDYILPIAIVNLSSFQLIEAARILAIFYSNNAIAEKNDFKKLQFYLQSTDEKDLLFAGKDVDEIRERVLKTSMTAGTMSNDISIIEQLLRRMT